MIDWIKDHKKLTALLALTLITLVWYLTKNSKTGDPRPQLDMSPTAVVEQTSDDDTSEHNDAPATDDTKTKQTPAQVQFDQKLDDLKQTIQKCRQSLQKIFPESHDDDLPPINSAEQALEIIDKFYGAVNSKIDKTNEIFKVITSEADNFSNPGSIFQELASLEDCGEFEEELLIEGITEFLETHQDASKYKEEIVRKISQSFSMQLKREPSLYHTYSKISALEQLLDSSLLPNHIEEDIRRLTEVAEEVEYNYSKSLPSDILERKSLSPHDIAFIRSIERKETERLNELIQEVLRDLQ